MSQAADRDAPVTRRGRPGYDQATVLRRAIELFNTQGYDATSMGDLARELGLSKSALYHHVPSKQHLLAQALDEALGELDEIVERATGPSAAGTAYDRLRTVLAHSVEVLVAHQPAVTLLLRVRGNSAVEVDALQRRRRIDAALTGLVERAVAEGAVRADVSPDLVARLLFGMVNSLVEWHRPGRSSDVEELVRTVTALAFDGLAFDGPASRGPAVGDPALPAPTHRDGC